MASQITSLTIVYLTVYSGANQRKHQSSASLAFVRGIHRGPVNSPHRCPVTQKMFPFDDVIMIIGGLWKLQWRIPFSMVAHDGLTETTSLGTRWGLSWLTDLDANTRYSPKFREFIGHFGWRHSINKTNSKSLTAMKMLVTLHSTLCPWMD